MKIHGSSLEKIVRLRLLVPISLLLLLFYIWPVRVRCCCRVLRGFLFLLLPAVISVPREQLFHFFLPEQQQILLLVFIFTGLWDLVSVVLTAQNILRDEGGIYIFLEQRTPWETFEPRVFFNFIHASLASQPIAGLSLNHLRLKRIYSVDKVSSFARPARWHLFWFDLNLLAQYLVSNLSPISAIVGPSTKH